MKGCESITVPKPDPLYCAANQVSASLTKLIKDNTLNTGDWIENSMGQFYFDCKKRNLDFVVDP
jgi:hypothetical protein